MASDSAAARFRFDDFDDVDYLQGLLDGPAGDALRALWDGVEPDVEGRVALREFAEQTLSWVEDRDGVAEPGVAEPELAWDNAGVAEPAGDTGEAGFTPTITLEELGAMMSSRPLDGGEPAASYSTREIVHRDWFQGVQRVMEERGLEDPGQVRLDLLELSTGTMMALQRGRLYRIEQVARLSDEQILSIRDFNQVHLDEVRGRLDEINRRLN